MENKQNINTRDGVPVHELTTAVDSLNDLLSCAVKGEAQWNYYEKATLEELKELLSQLAYCSMRMDELTTSLHDCMNSQFGNTDTTN